MRTGLYRSYVHTRVIGTKSRNLDTFFTEENTLNYLLERNSRGCDIAVMEGVMGYYDGVGGTTFRASAYDLARTTRTPAVLIVNSKGMSFPSGLYQRLLPVQGRQRDKGRDPESDVPNALSQDEKKDRRRAGSKGIRLCSESRECTIESRHLGLVLPGKWRI